MAINRETCDRVAQQLSTLLGNFIQVDTWCLREPPRPEVLDNDIFIISTHAVWQQVSSLVPPDKRIIVASRTLEIDNLEELLALSRGTEALILSNHEKTALEIIEVLKSFAIDNVVLHPRWPDKKTYPRHIKLAITAGQQPVPPEIERVIDLGVRTLNLSTLVELIIELDLPREIVNEISARYISAIISILHRRIELAEQNEKFKDRVQAILDTVDHGIIAIDEDQKIRLVNPAAEKMLNLGYQELIDRSVTDIIPQISDDIMTGSNTADSIKKIGDSHYVINTTSIFDAMNNVTGTVISLKAANEVKELDSKVRRELKRKGNIAKHTFNDILGSSEEITRAIDAARKFAGTDLTILLEGESGTGKELFAQSFHNASNRRNTPFVAINFAALPENLVESELFGYEEGAFTGARKGGKTGLFEEAHTGTIFLDEIGDASTEVQKKLLRVLEEKEVRRVGGNTVTPVDVRVIASTNRNLRQLMKEGKFRLDLYFRLCSIQIVVPPLRRRRQDIPVLLAFFANRLYRREIRLADQLKDYLSNYSWPGNVRELQNIVNFLCNTIDSNDIATMKHLPQYLSECPTDYNGPATAAFAHGDVEAVVSRFAKLGSLEPLFWVLSELKKAERFNQSAGRQSISMALAEQTISFPEHKVRVMLKRLEQGGCVITNVTRQGSRLSKLGNDVLSYLESSNLTS